MNNIITNMHLKHCEIEVRFALKNKFFMVLNPLKVGSEKKLVGYLFFSKKKFVVVIVGHTPKTCL